MRVHPSDPDLFLVEPIDLQDPVPEKIRDDLDLYRQIFDWSNEYLCEPHPELGREGPVCPFVSASLKKRHYFLTVEHGRDLDEKAIEDKLLRLQEWFLEIEPREGYDAIFKTILCLFPDIEPAEVPRLIDGTQARLQPSYVKKGLMVGEFHAGPPQKPGLWSESFRPLRSPVPMLVTRHMVSVDIAFLKGDPRLLGPYLERFRYDVPAHLREQAARAANRFGFHYPDPRRLSRVHPRVAEVIKQARVPVVVVRHDDLGPDIDSPQAVARALNLDIDRVTKSLFIRTGKDYAVVVCPVEKRVDLRLIAEQLGWRRISLADREEVAGLLGYAPGGISPIAIDKTIPVYLDESLMGFPSVLVAAGEIRVELELNPRDLERIARAKVIPLAKEESLAVPA